MHGNNPTRDSIENALTRHAGQGRIRSWRQHPDFGRYGNAPKWQVELAGNAIGPQGGSTVEIRTYQEGHLFCTALASAEQAARADNLNAAIASAYEGYTPDELSAAFDRVKPRGNWKEPIDARLPADTSGPDRHRIDVAITFYTGGVAGWQRDGDDGDWTVTAPGYYACIGA